MLVLLVLFGFIMTQFYSATLTGSLLMKKPKYIKTIRNLIDSPLKIWLERQPYSMNLIETAVDPDARDLIDHRLLSDTRTPNDGTGIHFLDDIYEGIRRVKMGGYAYHIETAPAYKVVVTTFNELEVCDLTEIEFIKPQYMYAAVQKNSPIRKIISYGYGMFM